MQLCIFGGLFPTSVVIPNALSWLMTFIARATPDRCIMQSCDDLLALPEVRNQARAKNLSAIKCMVRTLSPVGGHALSHKLWVWAADVSRC
eukprot:5557936-Amphidinium_carterae.1